MQLPVPVSEQAKPKRWRTFWVSLLSVFGGWYFASAWLTLIFEQVAKVDLLKTVAQAFMQLPDVSGFAQVWLVGLGLVGGSVGLMSAVMYFHWQKLEQAWSKKESSISAWRYIGRLALDMHILVVVFIPLICVVSFLLEPRFGSILFGFVYAFAAAGLVCLLGLLSRAADGGLRYWPSWLIVLVAVISWRWITLAFGLMQG